MSHLCRHFGWLAGSFERWSGVSKPIDAHPYTFNATRILIQGMSDTPADTAEGPMVRDKAVEAGYAKGRWPELAVEQVFSEWFAGSRR